MDKKIFGLLLVSITCAAQSPMGVSTVLEDVSNTLQSERAKIQAELSTLPWFHPKRVGLKRKLKEVQTRLDEIDYQELGMKD